MSQSPEMLYQKNPENPKVKHGEFSERLRRTMLYCKIQPVDGESVLHNSILAGHESLTLAMIEDMVSNTYLSVKNHSGETPLHLAVLNNMIKVVRGIVVKGGDVNVRNSKGDTPLHLACKNGFKDCVEALTQNIKYDEVKHTSYTIQSNFIPQNLELKNYEGLTCLHLAVIHHHLDIVEYLVNEMHASVNGQEGKSGKTALHLAVESGNESAVNFLVLTCGVDVNAEMYNQRTPLDIAVDMGRADLQSILVKFGGEMSDINDEESDMDAET